MIDITVISVKYWLDPVAWYKEWTQDKMLAWYSQSWLTVPSLYAKLS